MAPVQRLPDMTVPIPRWSVQGNTVYLGGELDIATIEELRAALRPVVASGDDVLVDLAAVTFMDSCTVVALLAARSAAESRGGHLRLRAVGPRVARLLHLFNAEPALEIVRSG